MNEIEKLILGSKQQSHYILLNKTSCSTHWNSFDGTYINNVEPQYDSIGYIDLIKLENYLKSKKEW